MTKVESILAAHGFEVVRQKKHKVWRDENGRTIVTPASPSDRRWNDNAIGDLSRVLGIKKRDLMVRPRRRAPEGAPQHAGIPAETVAAAEPPPPAPPLTAPYTKAEQKKLRRLFKHEQDRAKKREAHLVRFGEVARDCACYRMDLIDEGREPVVAYLLASVEAVKRLHRMGFRDARITVVMNFCPCSECGGEIYDMPIPVVRGVAIDAMTGEARVGGEWVDEMGEHKFKCVLMPEYQVGIRHKGTRIG
jgi:hypothetical protein